MYNTSAVEMAYLKWNAAFLDDWLIIPHAPKKQRVKDLQVLECYTFLKGYLN